MSANLDLTNVWLCSSNGVFIFNNSDTSKLIDATYWSRSSDSKISHINAHKNNSSSDNRVIVISDSAQYSEKIWFSTDYGSNFYKPNIDIIYKREALLL